MPITNMPKLGYRHIRHRLITNMPITNMQKSVTGIFVIGVLVMGILVTGVLNTRASVVGVLVVARGHISYNYRHISYDRHISYSISRCTGTGRA